MTVCALFPARHGCWKGLIVLGSVIVVVAVVAVVVVVVERARVASDLRRNIALTWASGLAAALEAIAAVAVPGRAPVPAMEHGVYEDGLCKAASGVVKQAQQILD